MKVTNTQMTAYLDYVNNYLSVSRFAEDYAMSVDEAYSLIEKCRNNTDKRGKK